eukprot:1148767-Pelagomonas_calceolata.AAC.1
MVQTPAPGNPLELRVPPSCPSCLQNLKTQPPAQLPAGNRTAHTLHAVRVPDIGAVHTPHAVCIPASVIPSPLRCPCPMCMV